MGSSPLPGDAGANLVAVMLERAVAGRIPLSGSIAMTHRCHLRCVHCYLGAERTLVPEGGELDTAFWSWLVDQVADAGCLNLLITGGEPLLRPDFPEIYERAVRRGILVSVFTNGTLVGDAILALFGRLPPQLVEVTLYGASAESYERVTGVPGSHRRCLAGVDAMLERGIPVALKAVILCENQHEIPELRRMAERRGVSFRLDGAVFPCRDGQRDPLAHRVSAEQAVALEMEDETLLKRTADHFQQLRGRAPEERLFACMAGLTSFHVDPQGTLLPCLMVQTHGYDLRRGSFREGWDDAVRRFGEQAIAPGYQCHSCEKRFLCGVCPAQSGLETGSPHRKAEFLCQLGEARLRAIAPLVDR